MNEHRNINERKSLERVRALGIMLSRNGTDKSDSYWFNKLHNIVVRCCYQWHHRYKDYGGRGIGICHEWYDSITGAHHTIAFRDWCVSHGWEPGLQIDRIDNDGDYSPDNCRFVDAYDNSRNRRNTIRVVYNGVEMCAKDACYLSGIPYTTFIGRIRTGWDSQRALIIPRGFRRPGLCFYMTKGGICMKGNQKSKKECPFMADSERRHCVDFHEFKKGENAYEL